MTTDVCESEFAAYDRAVSGDDVEYGGRLGNVGIEHSCQRSLQSSGGVCIIDGAGSTPGKEARHVHAVDDQPCDVRG